MLIVLKLPISIICGNESTALLYPIYQVLKQRISYCTTHKHRLGDGGGKWKDRLFNIRVFDPVSIWCDAMPESGASKQYHPLNDLSLGEEHLKRHHSLLRVWRYNVHVLEGLREFLDFGIFFPYPCIIHNGKMFLIICYTNCLATTSSMS